LTRALYDRSSDRPFDHYIYERGGAGQGGGDNGASADASELYVVRLTAENDGTKAEAFSVISWSKFKEAYLKKALSGCFAHLQSAGNRGSFKADSSHAPSRMK
jgi:hypothetical protein